MTEMIYKDVNTVHMTLFYGKMLSARYSFFIAFCILLHYVPDGLALCGTQAK